MDGLAEQATHSGATGNTTIVRRRLAREVTVQISARLTNMIHACLQPPKGEAARILHGQRYDEEDEDDEGTDANATTQRPAAPRGVARAAGA
eukprot:7512922-Lingulodinium_polyedra.AAC.1